MIKKFLSEIEKIKIIYLLILVLVLSSCTAEEPAEKPIIEHELVGKWFHSFPNKVGDATGTWEQGEAHYIMEFESSGEFRMNRIILGLYEGTTISDTSAIRIESGTYEIKGDSIQIHIESMKWWDSFYDNMEDFEETTRVPNQYEKATYEIVNDKLTLIYYIFSDIIGEQDLPGLKRVERLFTKI